MLYIVVLAVCGVFPLSYIYKFSKQVLWLLVIINAIHIM